MLSGALACVMSFKYSESLGGLKGYEWAFILIGAAAIFDFCDGAAARLLKAYSAVGKELDSLSDLISFGLAPALLMYNTIGHYNPTTDGICFWGLAALYIVVNGGLRLARFNVDDKQSTSFIGLPIPANAIFWIGAIAWMHSHTYIGNIGICCVIFVMSSLMTSRMEMFSLKFKNFDWRENFRRYVILAAAVLFVVTEGLSGLAWTIVLYILISAVARKKA